MNEVSRIKVKIGILLQDMYALGKEDGMREEQRDTEEIVEAAHDRGVDEGYNAAKREFHAPDL